MSLARRLASLLFLATGTLAQTPKAISPPPSSLAFDAASVRPSRPGTTSQSTVPLDSGNVYGALSADNARSAAGGYFVATHQALWRFIAFAWKLSGTQELALRFSMFSGAPKSGAPFWVTGSFAGEPEYFDITARAPAGTTIDGMRNMMQSLLADRFHLRVHFLSSDAPVFALVLAQPNATGQHLQLHPPTDQCPDTTAAPASHDERTSIVGDLPPICGVIAHVASPNPGQHYGGRAVPLSLLATSIPTMTGLAVTPRPVIDRTGLDGLYDFHLTWTHDATPEESVVSENGANFRDALKSQLGLVLRSTHAPISFLIIDHVDRPSEN